MRKAIALCGKNIFKELGCNSDKFFPGIELVVRAPTFTAQVLSAVQYPDSSSQSYEVGIAVFLVL